LLTKKSDQCPFHQAKSAEQLVQQSVQRIENNENMVADHQSQSPLLSEEEEETIEESIDYEQLANDVDQWLTSLD
jgi:hypothetical protein